MIHWRTTLLGPGRPAPRSALTGLFCLAAVFFLLFYGLGDRSLAGSEDRWAEIARNMLLRRDWFHPVINGEIYFDKPLLSYWLIVIVAFCTQTLNEFAVRLPGAIAGLLTLVCSCQIAAAWFDRRIAWLSVCLVVTSYGFLFWTHTASAELSNLALITAAVAWFVPRRERTDFAAYAGFYLLCAVGCQLKGLTAFVVPVLVITPFVLRDGRWKTHLNFAHLGALVLAAGVFLLPYLGASMLALPAGIEVQHNHLSGLDLLIRENLVRFFEPFDHVDPFYSYFYEVPRIVFPWSIFLIAGLAYYLPRYPRLDQTRRWLLEAIALVFLFFSLSGSRRWYYILPIMPFCMILIAAYLSDPEQQRWRRPAALATVFLLGAAAVLLIAIPGAALVYFAGAPLPIEFRIGSLVILLAVGVIVLLGKGRMAILQRATGLDSAHSTHFLPILLLAAAVEMAVIFGLALPGADHYRQIKPFALFLAGQLGPDEQLVFYKRANTSLVFYLNPRDPIPVINSKPELSKYGRNRWVIVSDGIDREGLFKEFPELKTSARLPKPVSIAENPFSEKTNLVAYRLD